MTIAIVIEIFKNTIADKETLIKQVSMATNCSDGYQAEE